MTLTRSFDIVRCRAAACLARFREEQSGVAAIEFALIAPVLIFLYIGLYQISFIIQQDRNVSHATSVMGDLATRVGEMQEGDIEDVFQAAVEIISISNTATLIQDVEMDLSSYALDTNGNVERVGFAETSNSNLPPIDTSKFNSRMLSAQIGTVVARVRYRYTMTSNLTDAEKDGVNSTKYTGRNGIMLAEQFVMRPRVSSSIPFGDTLSANPNDEFTCNISTNRTVGCSAN